MWRPALAHAAWLARARGGGSDPGGGVGEFMGVRLGGGSARVRDMGHLSGVRRRFTKVGVWYQCTSVLAY